MTWEVFPRLSGSAILWSRGCAAAVPQTQALHQQIPGSFLPQTLPTLGWFPAAPRAITPQSGPHRHPAQPCPTVGHIPAPGRHRGAGTSKGWGAAGAWSQHGRGWAEPSSRDGAPEQRVSLGAVRCGACPHCPQSWDTHRGLSRVGMRKRSTESSLGSSSLCSRDEAWTAPLVCEWRNAGLWERDSRGPCEARNGPAARQILWCHLGPMVTARATARGTGQAVLRSRAGC